mgnify:CR=1 FL=1
MKFNNRELEFHQFVKNWAKLTGLKDADPSKQFLSLCEEFGENVDYSTPEEECDAIGDAMVTILVLAEQLGIDIGYGKQDPYEITYSSSFSHISLSFIGQLGGQIRRGRDAKESLVDLYSVVRCYAFIKHLPLNRCLDMVQCTLSEREGMMIDGSYIKREDFTPAQESHYILRLIDIKNNDGVNHVEV